MKELIVSILRGAIERARAAGQLTADIPSIGIEAPRDPAHGDIASNIALTLAKPERKATARDRGDHQVAGRRCPPEVSEVSVAGPGFINFKMSPAYWHSEMRLAASAGAAFWKPRAWKLRGGNGRKVQVEFLSANPTGPVTVGHGRNAVLGDTIARLYEAAGFDVTREYYFNDGGRQMKLLGESVRARYLQAHGIDAPMPEDGYQGEYTRYRLASESGRGDALGGIPTSRFSARPPSKRSSPTSIRLATRLGIRFDVFTNELDLFIRQGPGRRSKALSERSLTVEKDGAIWLRGEPLGLPKDAVLVRSGPDKQPTYRTPDIAYHIEKLKRGFDLIVDVFGADHIAEHQQVIAAVKALGYDVTPVSAIIYQFVTLTRAGEKVKMSTRKATYVTLDELIDEVGADVVRFFFLFRKSDSQLDFDLELAKKQAPENPVFYVQYAHARLASIFREGVAKGFIAPRGHLVDRSQFARRRGA